MPPWTMKRFREIGFKRVGKGLHGRPGNARRGFCGQNIVAKHDLFPEESEGSATDGVTAARAEPTPAEVPPERKAGN